MQAAKLAALPVHGLPLIGHDGEANGGVHMEVLMLYSRRDAGGKGSTHLLQQLVEARRLDALAVEEGAVGGAQVHQVGAHRRDQHPVPRFLRHRPAQVHMHAHL